MLNAIEVELLRNALGSIAEEMYFALMKSAYSTNIKERRDHSAAISSSSAWVGALCTPIASATAIRNAKSPAGKISAWPRQNRR